MRINRFCVFWAYLYCTLVFLPGNGLATLYDDRRGQPEMQQAMDNAPLPAAAARYSPLPSGQDHNYPILLTQKTSTLLSEAQNIIQRIKEIRERKWLEDFIHRLALLATDLEESNTKKTLEEVQKTTLQPFDTKQPAVSASSIAPVVNKFNKAQAKYQVTSAQVNDVLPINEGLLNRHVVTKPSLQSANNEDELVQQLHNEDRKMKSKFTTLDATYHTKPLDSTITQAVTPPTSPLTNGNSKWKKVIQSQDKTRQTLLSKLLNEIDVLKQQGEAEKEAEKSLKHMDTHHVADFTNPDFVLNQKYNFLEGDDEFEIEEDEGAAAGELDVDEEPLKNTVSPSWPQIIEAAKAEEAHHHSVPERQEKEESKKQFIAPEPTMSDEMERQLRAGRIVVLSDSLVRTNSNLKDSNENITKLDSEKHEVYPSRSLVTSAVERHPIFKRSPHNQPGEDK